MSKAGRDKGRFFVIVERIDELYVQIADGQTRRFNQPKRKKIKHLDIKPVTLPTVRLKLESGEPVYDSELRANLEALGYNQRVRRTMSDFKEG